MKSGGASRTAVFMCQGRAVADGRLAVGSFADPVAGRLLRPEELAPVQLARQDPSAVPTGRDRFTVESLRACAEVVVPRTVVIDEAVSAAVRAGSAQVVLLGAGLDTRPWRLTALRGVAVFCVDHPASQADARDRTAGVTPVAGRTVLVPVDLTTQVLDGALTASGLDPAVPTVWVWEGVVPYLRPPEVAATVSALARLSAPGSVLVVNYQTPSTAAAVGRRLMNLTARLTGVEPITADEPWRSAWTPSAMADLLHGNGFTVGEDRDLWQVAGSLGSPTGHSRSLRNGRVAVARYG